MFDLFREIGQTLSNNKLRTALTGFAVAWGIFMLIILLGMSRGVLNKFESFNSDSQSDRLTVWNGRTSKPYKGYKDNRFIQMKDKDLKTITSRNNRHVAEAYTTNDIDTAVVSTQKDYISKGLRGVYPQELARGNNTLLYGRFINDIDLKEERKVIVIHRNSARLLFGSEEKAVGQRVDALRLSWLVVGVFDNEWNEQPMVPFTTVKMLNGYDDDVWRIDVNLRDVHDMASAEEATNDVRTTLATVHEFDPTDENAVWINNRFENYLRGLEGLNIMNVAIWVIGIFTMLSGIVGVSNIMFVSVKERTHEIGIRRAIGAKPRSILIQVVTESVAITAMFGYIGLVAGMALMAFISEMMQGVDFIDNPTIDLRIAIEVTIVLIIAGALAGLFPALKATKVRPVEALRDE
ncbi:MAG: ABC transporter permease [Bacteroidales bacterium]|nr:ABC transporter permease [Bacteroidales bacterium]